MRQLERRDVGARLIGDEYLVSEPFVVIERAELRPAQSRRAATAQPLLKNRVKQTVGTNALVDPLSQTFLSDRVDL